MCKEFGQLPKSGGLLDQPARLMHLFELVNLAESERAERDQKMRDGATKHASNGA